MLMIVTFLFGKSIACSRTLNVDWSEISHMFGSTRNNFAPLHTLYSTRITRHPKLILKKSTITHTHTHTYFLNKFSLTFSGFLVRKMEGIEHKTISANGLNIHIAEKGEGPIVLFLHGFPKLWYSWRHQINFMASHGYRAVAPDLRGYGDTTGAPIHDFTKFSVVHVVGDVVALLDVIAPNEEVFVVAHDWGANIAWHLCLFRPDKVKALVALSVHYIPRNPVAKMIETMKAFYGEDHYMVRFQEPGDMEAEIADNIGTKTFLKKFLSHRDPAPFFFPKGKGYNEDTTDSLLPAWLTEEDLNYYTSKYEKTGFTGPINYYRALDLTWELTAPWTGAQVKVPTKFVVGELDLVYNLPGAKEFIHGGEFQKHVPLLQEVVVMEGVAHFINEEKPDDINNHIYQFLQQF